MKYLIVGGNTGGAGAAARLRRLDEHAKIVMFEKGGFVSFSNCSLPYRLSEVVDSTDKLVLNTPQSLQAAYNIETRIYSEVIAIDRARKKISVKDLKSGDVMLHSLWARRHGTKYNGAPYIVQRAGEAVYSEAGKAQLKEQVAYYMRNAKTIYEGLKSAGYNVSGGVNAPYIWLETPRGMSSWEFFDYLLEHAGVVGTPGSGFGPSGEGYFRLTAFGSHENTKAAIRRIQEM